MTTALIKASDVNIDDLQRTAKMMVASGYFDAAKDATQAIAQLAVKILAGREMGYGPFASVQGIHVIQGKPALSANLMAAAVKAHPAYDYRVRKMDADAVSIEFFQDGKSLGVSEFTTADAKEAGLVGKDIWKKFPRNLLFARAMSNGVRWFCPDVFNGNTVYVPEELGAVVDGETGEIIEAYPRIAASNGNGKRHIETPDIQSLDELPELDPNGEPNPFHGTQPTQNGALGVTDHQKKLMHVLGTAMYNGTWEAKRHELVKAITKGRTESSNDLTGKEAGKMITGIEGKLRERYEEMASAFVGAGGNPAKLENVDDMDGFDLANEVKRLAKEMEPVTA